MCVPSGGIEPALDVGRINQRVAVSVRAHGPMLQFVAEFILIISTMSAYPFAGAESGIIFVDFTQRSLPAFRASLSEYL